MTSLEDMSDMNLTDVDCGEHEKHDDIVSKRDEHEVDNVALLTHLAEIKEPDAKDIHAM